MARFLKNKRIIILFISLIILLSGIVTLFSLGWQKNFIGEDSGVHFNYPCMLPQLYHYTWYSLDELGRKNVVALVGILWANFILGLFQIGLTSIFIKRLLYFLFLTISALGSFCLVSFLIKISLCKKNKAYFPAFISSLIYMFNHFTMTMLSLPTLPYHLSYMLLPWTLLLFIYNLQVKTSFFSTLLFSLLFLLLSGGNPSNTISIILFFLFYLIFFRKKVNPHSKKFIFLSLVLLLLLSSYIYLPMIAIQSVPSSNIGTLEDWLISLRLHSSRASFLNLFQLGGSVTWPNFPYYPLYTKNLFFILLSFSIPSLALSSLLIRKARKIKLFFALIILISLFFAKGIHPPLEKLFLFLYTNLPYSGMYRAAYYKFIYFTALAYAILIGLFTHQAFNSLKKQSKKIKYFLYLIPLIICLLNWPFFSKQVVKNDFLTQIPEEYENLSVALDKDSSQFRVLSFPPSPRGRGLLLQWPENNKYVGPHPDAFFLQKPILNSYWFIKNGFNNTTVADSWSGTKFENKVDSLLPFTGILNLKYIFLHQDFLDQYDFGSGPTIMEGQLKAKTISSILDQQEGVEKIKETDYFALYQLSDKYFLPHFYIPQKSIYINNDIKTMLNLYSFIDSSQQPEIYLKNSPPSSLDQMDEIFVEGELKNFPLLDENKALVLQKNQDLDFKNMVFEFDIPKAGEYEIYLDKGNGWENLAKKEFDIKKHQFTFHLAEPENLAASQKPISQEINQWEKDNLYYLSFDYITKGGSLGVEFLELRSYNLEGKQVSKPVRIFALPLKSEKQWKKFNIIIPASNNASAAKINFSSKADPGQSFKVDFKNFKIYKLPQPKLILKRTVPNIKPKIPSITSIKINPTKYKVEVKDVKEPYTLIFSETFHPQWQASWQKKSIPKKRHFLVNGYANAWQILPEDVDHQENYQLIIEFGPQKWFYIGLFISGATLITSILYLFLRKAIRLLGRRK